MKRIILLTIIINWLFINALTAQNPFQEFDVEVPVITLCNGKFPEFIPNDTIHRMGTVVIDTRTGKIIELIDTDSIKVTYNYRPDVASRWISPDPLSEEFPDRTPYNYVKNNPIARIDTDGRLDTWYVTEGGDVLMQTNDGSNDIVTVPQNQVSNFEYYAQSYKNEGMKPVYESKGWNDYMKSEYGLSGKQLSEEQVSMLSMLNSSWSKENAVEYWLNPTASNAAAFSFSEALSQWTNPELVITGLSAGVAGYGAVNRNFVKAYNHSYKYDTRVRVRAVQDPTSHNFPYTYDDAILSTQPIPQKNGYNIYQLNGSMNGKNGVFEIGLTKEGVIDHRFFRPNK